MRRVAIVTSSRLRRGSGTQELAPSAQLEAMDYKMVNDAISAITTMFKSVKDLFVRLKETSSTGMDQAVFAKVRKELEDVIGLEEYYRIEEQKVENRE